MTESLSWRVATRNDRSRLEDFSCGDRSHPYIAEVEDFIRGDAIHRHLNATIHDDFRLLLFESEGDLVAVAAHERNWRVEVDGELLGTEIVLVALQQRYQRSRLQTGPPLVVQVMLTVLEDAVSRARGEWFVMLVHPDNARAARVCRRLGAEEIRVLDGYRLFFARG